MRLGLDQWPCNGSLTVDIKITEYKHKKKVIDKLVDHSGCFNYHVSDNGVKLTFMRFLVKFLMESVHCPYSQ